MILEAFCKTSALLKLESNIVYTDSMLLFQNSSTVLPALTNNSRREGPYSFIIQVDTKEPDTLKNPTESWVPKEKN